MSTAIGHLAGSYIHMINHFSQRKNTNNVATVAPNSAATVSNDL